MNNITKELEELLKPMNIPRHRKEVDKVNLKWLSKNLARKNKDHPNYQRAEALIQQSLEQKLYTH